MPETRRLFRRIRALAIAATLFCLMSNPVPAAQSTKHAVPKEHPRLLGSREQLQSLADDRAEAYQRVVQVARGTGNDDHAKMISMSLVCAIEQDGELGTAAVQMAMKYITGPIRAGHVTFAHDLARCAIVYDLCYDCWTQEQRAKFHEYMNKTVDANVRSETHVFHNGWYGYKQWGIGLACYAAYYENQRAPEILGTLVEDWRTRAAPALDLAGDGGGWAEGYYINYWLYEWLFFCEAARHCEGIDYYAQAPKFFENRAIASMFETYPGINTYNSRRPIPMGDGGGRVFGGDRDKVLSARRILVNYVSRASRPRSAGKMPATQAHQTVHTFNEQTPRSSVGDYAYKDFLWRDTTVAKGDLKNFKLSHISPGPGYVYARSSWDDDATYFFFKCGDRFTAHQHLDVGHFLIYKYEELAGDGGHYDSFGSEHDVNYHLRTIAHSTMLLYDPSEKWPGIRAGNVTGNDGGQAHNWPHHNGAVSDPAQWYAGRELYDIADIVAFEDRGDFLYVAGDCTRAYCGEGILPLLATAGRMPAGRKAGTASPRMGCFTRQIVFIRPGTFVIFDRVQSVNPQFKKTWLLQAMKVPSRQGKHLVITNGKGRLFVQTLLPLEPDVKLVAGPDLYSYGGRTYPPARDTGPAPECRIEVSPSEPRSWDYFLHVLTATGSDVGSVDEATVDVTGEEVTVSLGQAQIMFNTTKVAGAINLNGQQRPFAGQIVP